MPELDAIVWSYIFAGAAWGVLAAVMLFAGVRNHLAHRMRPVVWLLVAIGAVLSVQNVMRVYSAWLRTTGETTMYLAFLRSEWWVRINLVSAGLAVAFVIALLVAYPQFRIDKHKRHND